MDSTHWSRIRPAINAIIGIDMRNFRVILISILLLIFCILISVKNQKDHDDTKARLGLSISDLRALHSWWSQFTYDRDSTYLGVEANHDNFSILTMAEHSDLRRGNPSLNRMLDAQVAGGLKFYCVPKNGNVLGEWMMESRLLVVDIHGHVSNSPAL